MGQAIKIPVRDLSPQKIRELQLQYPNAELHLDTGSVAPGFMTEKEFWTGIERIDWEQQDGRAQVQPVVEWLQVQVERSIFDFSDWLSLFLYQLDTMAIAKEIGEYAWGGEEAFSVDHFLYVRACVIANGPDFFQRVRQDASLAPKNMTFEPLLWIAAYAYEQKTGNDYTYLPSWPIETFSNKEGWTAKPL